MILVVLFLQQDYFSLVHAQESDEPIFLDVSRHAGITDNRQGITKTVGQAWGDYDNDGWVDLYVTDTDGPNTLYRNNQDGTFSVSDLGDRVQLINSESGGAIFVDYDNDGWRDLYIVNRGPNKLFRNIDGKRFENQTQFAGVGDPDDGKSASWGDFDQDGYLDLYITNWSCYPDCGRPTYGDSDRLFHNDGDGTFTDVTPFLGAQTMGAGHEASFIDYDNDGDLDIYLINDQFINPIGNVLWRNDGEGCMGWCFTEISESAGVDQRVMGMGIATADYDNDGDIDIYFSNAGPMTLLQNQLNDHFENVAVQAGVQTPDSVGWGSIFFDYNNDGWQDLYLAVAMKMDTKGLPANILFHNNGDNTFTRIPCNTGAADVGGTIGVAYADYDHDGQVDFVIGNHVEGYRLYHNQGSAGVGNHWVTIELIGGGPVNRDAVGARVYVTTDDGMNRLQEIVAGSSMGSGNELALHFGLADHLKIQELTLVWPDGLRQTFENVKVDRRYKIEYPTQPDQQILNLEFIPESQVNEISVVIAVAIILLVMLGFVKIGRGQFVDGIISYRFVLLLIAVFLTSCAPASPALDDQLAKLIKQFDVQPLNEPEPDSPEKIKLGEMLFWDPELSGNRDTACATCHHPSFGSGDGLSLPVGTGGRGLGDARVLGEEREFVPRNATPIYNLGYPEWDVMFWDGRVFGDAVHGFENPAGDDLPEGLDNALAVQAMFPVTSRDEMRGDRGDVDVFGVKNEITWIKDVYPERIWEALMFRLFEIPEYVELFSEVYPDITANDLGFEHAANAIAAYEASAFSFIDTPWDNYLRGDMDALSLEAKQGAILFYGGAGCNDCHIGDHFTDWDYYNLAVPHVGPGKPPECPLDYGRARVTGDDCDLFAFRTPPLRNVTLTGPWMHNGAYTTLEGAVRHHLDPVSSLRNYNSSQLSATLIAVTMVEQPDDNAILTCQTAHTEIVELTEEQFQFILAFLESLTSPTAANADHLIPDTVPSGLPVGGQ